MDKLSPEHSPNTLKTEVRRANHRPIFILLLIAFVFVVIVVMTVAKRAKSQVAADESIRVRSPVKARPLVEDVLEGYQRAVKAQSNEVKVVQEEKMVLPVAVLDDPDRPPLPQREKNLQESLIVDPEAERIRQEKMRLFEEAVKAKLRIELPIDFQPAKARALSQDETEVKLAEVKERLKARASDDPNGRYQAALLALRERMRGDANDAYEGESDLEFSKAQGSERWKPDQKMEVPSSPFLLRAGSVIPGIMISGIKSTLPGQIIAQVSQPVYDTATGRHLLIPQGTRLIGLYSAKIAYGQEALMIAWQRLIFPDGKALDIGAMPGSDQAGYAGFRDKTNNHYLRIFSSALLMSGIVGGISYSQQQSQARGSYYQPSAGSAMSEALGQQLGQVSAQMIGKNLNLAPRLEIRPGYRFNVTVVKDLSFNRPYHSFDYSNHSRPQEGRTHEN